MERKAKGFGWGTSVSPPGPLVVRFITAVLTMFRVLLAGPGDVVSKVINRVIIGVTPFRVLITLPITYLLSPLPLQVGFRVLGFKESLEIS